MLVQYKSQDYIKKRIEDIELRVTDICKAGTDLVPADESYSELFSLRKELLDLTDGENTIMFDKAGRPAPAYVLRCDKDARVDQYKDFLGPESTTYSSSWENVLPGFKINSKPIEYLLIQKYRMVQYNGKNYSVGLYMMPHAYSGGGFTVSYDGINSECNRINALAFDEGLDIHEITWDEYGILAAQFAKNIFEPHGNDNWGKSSQDSSEIGAPTGYKYNENYIHTLTGSGPLTWRHNGKPTGIADLRGNTRVVLSGIRTFGGEIQLIDFRSTTRALTSSELGNSSSLWKAIKEGGELVTPGSDSTYKIDFLSVPEASGKVGHRISTTISNRAPSRFYSSILGKNVELAEGVATAPMLKYINLLPYDINPLLGQQYMINTAGESACLLAGANWDNGSSGGAAYRGGNYSFSSSAYHNGGLVASHSPTLKY